MSFVPLQGRATLVSQHPPRDSEIEFSGPARTIRMPMRGAIPVLTRAIRVEDAHPSVGLLSGATLLAMKLLAAGRVRLSESGDSWRVGPLGPEDDDRLRALATARAHGETTVDDAEDVIRLLLDAVADAMTRPPGLEAGGGDPLTRRRDVADRRRPEDDDEDPDLPDQVRIALRIEAPEEALVGGGVVVVPQAHDVDDDTHFVDAEQLWDEGEARAEHGFSRRARLSLSVALRRAAEAWTPLDRLQRQQVPDRMVLDADELADLLEHGLEALDGVGVDVFWPRGLRGELVPQGRVEVATGPREGQIVEGLFGTEAMFSFDWRLALAGDPLSDEEMSVLTGSKSPVIRLRDNWMVIDPVLARRARKRVTAEKRQIAPVVALQASLTGTLYLDGGALEVHPGATLEKVRDRIVDASVVAPLADSGRDDGHPARLPAARVHLAGRADRRGSRRLPGRRHGPGQDGHPDRAAPAPARAGVVVGSHPGGLPGQPDGQLGGRDPPVRAWGPGAAVPRGQSRRWVVSTTGSC